ncbi:hypothetical protein SASPL_156694 [Salvia splendens]|uniref:Uncharacterized protein n=1 Tax=Salvia splendens TaxID=180675 RepID=A0A8X8YVH9_SALSN|nr:hypothetical protein SASPL_156694 [Salvia splendens]
MENNDRSYKIELVETETCCCTCVLQFSILMDDFRKFKCSKCESQKEVDLLQSMRGMPDFMLDNLPSVYTLIQYADAASYTGIFEAFGGIEWRSIMDSVAGKCVFEQDFQKDAIYVFVKCLAMLMENENHIQLTKALATLLRLS